MSFEDFCRKNRQLPQVRHKRVIFDRRMTAFGRVGCATYPRVTLILNLP
jgi:hypothetical protein